MSRAEDIYNKIKNGGISQVDNLINDMVSEELFLDYKCVRTPNGTKKLHDDDLGNLSKAISGFGNSDGGVIIWGINCRTVEGKGDLPVGYQAKTVRSLMEFDPNWLKSLIEGASSGSTLPPHQRVENFPLVREDGSDGVLITYIPAGMSTPLRAVHGGKDCYYIRAGSNFIPAPHGVLASLFGRRPQPILRADVQLFLDTRPGLSAPQSKPQLGIELKIKIINVGRGIAEDAFITFDKFSGSFKTLISYFDRDVWQTERSEHKTWQEPVMMITKNSVMRIPPRAMISVISVDLIHNFGIDPLSLEISGGCSGGPGFYTSLYVESDSVRDIIQVYNESPDVIPGRSGARKEINGLLNKNIRNSNDL